jgi:hypothetical protein
MNMTKRHYFRLHPTKKIEKATPEDMNRDDCQSAEQRGLVT